MEINVISLVMPCYNEAELIGEFYNRANTLASDLQSCTIEFIFVNDGSTDATSSLLDKLAETDNRVKVIHLAKNRGHQLALTAGMDHAAGDMIVTMDVDLQHPLELIPTFLDKINQGFDIVHTRRTVRKGDTFFKLFSAKIFYFLMRYFGGVKLIENTGDFRAFTSRVLAAVAGFRTSHRFLRGIFVEVGFKQCVVEYESHERYGGQSKYTLLKMFNLAIDAVLGFSAAPLRIIIVLSLVLWGCSLTHFILALYSHFILKITVPGWTSIIVLLFFFTGLILFSMAIIGSYIGRIYQQGQMKPLYWIEAIRNIDYNKINYVNRQLREVQLAQGLTHEPPNYHHEI